MPQLQMLENVLIPNETPLSMLESTFSRGLGRNWDENGQKVHLLPKRVKSVPNPARLPGFADE